MSNVASNSRDQIECVPIAELNQLKLKEKTETTTTNMDMISSLPDSLLCHILSFLPTRSSMATSILSRRWRHLWKDLQVLDLCDDPFYGPEIPGEEGEECFVAFVNAVLTHVHHIQKFCLSCNIFNKDAVGSWINAITGLHLQELHLYLENPYGSHNLPCGVFTCTSLVSLILEDGIFLDDLPSVYLPSLKTLKLAVRFVNLDKFLSGCPALETLDVYLLLGWEDEYDTQAIHMPHSLKSLTFIDNGFGETIEHLEIDTPSLEYLHICLDAGYLGILVSSFPNMVEADLAFHYEDVNVAWVPEFLKALSTTRLLVLTASTTECLLRAPSLDFPEFCCLLSLQIDFRSFNSRFLVDLLHNCHRLQFLIILNYGHQKSPEPSSWTQSIPNCVISHLSIIEFRGYRDSTEEHEFTAYILQRGLVLKTVTIHTDIFFGFDQKKKDHILKELSIVPRGSSICQLTLE